MQRLAIIATGGTIAMSGKGGDGGRLALSGADIVAAAPYLATIAKVEVHDTLSAPSASFDLGDLAKVARVAQACRTADGIVITHGTDTLEETAFAMACLTSGETPIVLTGAMRRFDQTGPDGAANLEAAAITALAPQSRGKGVMVVMDDEIHCGPLVRKSHAFRTHAFSSLPFGPMGWVRDRKVRYALAPALRFPSLSIGPHRPVVPILEAGPGLEPQVVTALGQVADGLVLSLPGVGHVAADAMPALQALAARIPVVFATRTGAGSTFEAAYGFAGSEADLIRQQVIPAGALDARKSRILLSILLSNGASAPEVAAVFAALP